MRKKITPLEFCSNIYKFPFHGLILMLTITDYNNFKVSYPIGSVYNSIKDIMADSSFFGSNMDVDNKLYVDHNTIVLPIKFEKLFPLEPRFWKKPSVHYSNNERMGLFGRLIKNYPFYKLVVTPLNYAKKTIFMSAFPYHITSGEKIIEAFMLNSDFPVDEKSKYAGIYSIEKGFHLNWQTGMLSELSFTQLQKDLH